MRLTYQVAGFLTQMSIINITSLYLEIIMHFSKPLRVGILLSFLAGIVQAQGLLGAVSPSSRSVQVGQSVTAFATLINTNQVGAANCSIVPAAGEPVTNFSFQATDSSTNAPIGGLNVSVNIPAGGSQTFVISMSPDGVLNAEDIALNFSCNGLDPAPVFAGVNTLLLSSSNDPVADIITIASTRSKDGIVDIAGENRFAVYSIAGINIGAAGTFNVVASFTGAQDVSAILCETNPTTGSCLANPSASVVSSLATDGVGTYSVFLLRNSDLAFDPANNRVQLRFTDANGLVSGQAGVAARGTGIDVVVGQIARTTNGFTINGVTFTNGVSNFTRVLRGGISTSFSSLKSGERGTIIGTKANEAVDTVSISGEVVKGPITLLNADQFEVVGQPVLVDETTIFDERDFSALAEGDFVEVDGVFDADGNIRASRIEYIAGGLAEAQKIILNGTITDNNAQTMFFAVNNIFVDYSGAILDDSLPGGAPADGQFVEIKSIQDLNGTTLIASKVEPAANGDGEIEIGLEAEVEGFITSFTSATDFSLSDQKITTSASTVFRGGIASDLALNVKIEAEGTIDNNGVLQASKTTFKTPDVVEIEGGVEASDSSARTITIMGVVIRVESSVVLQDDSSAGEDGLTFDSIAAGDWLRIKGRLQGNTVLANEVRRDDPRNLVRLQGSADNVSVEAGTLQILGVNIVTTAGIIYQTDDGSTVSMSDFFASLTPNSLTQLVKAKGTFSGGTITASELELELED